MPQNLLLARSFSSQSFLNSFRVSWPTRKKHRLKLKAFYEKSVFFCPAYFWLLILKTKTAAQAFLLPPARSLSCGFVVGWRKPAESECVWSIIISVLPALDRAATKTAIWQFVSAIRNILFGLISTCCQPPQNVRKRSSFCQRWQNKNK